MSHQKRRKKDRYRKTRRATEKSSTLPNFLCIGPSDLGRKMTEFIGSKLRDEVFPKDGKYGYMLVSLENTDQIAYALVHKPIVVVVVTRMGEDMAELADFYRVLNTVKDCLEFLPKVVHWQIAPANGVIPPMNQQPKPTILNPHAVQIDLYVNRSQRNLLN